MRTSTGVVFAALAGFCFVAAIAGACTTLEPWGDSSRAFYATVADIWLAFGLLLLTGVAGQLRSVEGWRRFAMHRPLAIWVVAAVAVAIPLWMSATNSLAASSIGEGGAPVPVVIVGGIVLAAAVAALMARRIALGLLVGSALGVGLLMVAFITAR